jgi:hypothetical protein
MYDDLPIKTCYIHLCSIATLNNQRVHHPTFCPDLGRDATGHPPLLQRGSVHPMRQPQNSALEQLGGPHCLLDVGPTCAWAASFRRSQGTGNTSLNGRFLHHCGP